MSSPGTGKQTEMKDAVAWLRSLKGTEWVSVEHKSKKRWPVGELAESLLDERASLTAALDGYAECIAAFLLGDLHSDELAAAIIAHHKSISTDGAA